MAATDYDVTTALGARVCLRMQAQIILKMLDGMTPEQLARSGWELDDLALLDKLAQMPACGVPDGWKLPADYR